MQSSEIDKEKYPWPLPRVILACRRDEVSAKDTAERLNSTKTAKKHNLQYKTMQIAGIFAHLTRN